MAGDGQVSGENYLYTFQDKKNREDIVALRWPKACLSCGTDISSDAHPMHGIVGLFHVDRKTTRGDRRHTQVLLKMPGLFHMCEICVGEVQTFLDSPSEKRRDHVEVATRLLESPWMEFFELEKTGVLRLPEGRFRDRLQELNPNAVLRSKDCPLQRLGLRRGGR